jgi:hypothetical protein
MALSLLDEDETRTITDVELMGSDLGDEGTSYIVRLIPKTVWRKLRAEHTRKKPTGGQGMADQVDAEKFADAVYDYALIGWSGFLFRGAVVEPDEMVTQGGKAIKAKMLVDETRKGRLIDIASTNVAVDPAAKEHSFRGSA